MDSQLAAFIGVTFLLAVTPGISTAVVVRNVLARGRRAGYMAAAGAATANAAWATAAAIGLSAIVERAPGTLDVIRLAGAAFLVWLGAKSIMSAVMGRMHVARTLSGSPGDPDTARSTGAPFVEGLVANLLHPSIAVYYLSVVPSFLPTPVILQPRFALLAAIHITMAFACHMAWGTGFHALAAFWSRPWAQRTLDVAIGVALVALALLLFV
jgi:threonine/homoserine/homoserine lactone efflux protein